MTDFQEQPISYGSEVQKGFDPQNPVAYHKHTGLDSPKLDIGDVEGGGGAKTATFIIGPESNSDSDTYDYVTDGTNDDVQIQAAIDALPTNGGSICLREGTYTLGSAAVTIAKNGVTIFGVGKGTIITCKTNFNLTFFSLGHASTQYSNCVFRDIYFDGNQANQSAGTAYIIDNSTLAVNVSNLEILDCYFINAQEGAIISGGTSFLAKDNYFSNWKAAKIAITVSGLDQKISHNYFTNTSTTAKFIIDNYSTIAIVSDNYFELPASYNTTAIESVAIVSSNYFNIGSSVGASCIIILTSRLCTNNIINGGTSPNAASIGIKTATVGSVTGNYIFRIGIQIYSQNSQTMIVGNVLLNATAEAIYIKGTGVAGTGIQNISGNHMQDADSANAYLYVDSAGTVKIIGNAFYKSSGSPGVTAIKESSASAGPCIILGNSLLFTGGGAVIADTSNPLTDVSHNILN